MKPLSLLSIVATLAASASAFSAATLTPGKSAPSLDVKSWYKGTPITSFDSSKTYVVEFWATWCGPCKQSIPHLTEMAKKNKDVTFIGVSIWEDEKGSNISDFVKDMGDKMDYNVCYSGNQTGMAKTWMAAAGQNGIPCAFVVKDNKVQWIGHPMTLEEPLAKIKDGSFDEAKFQQDYAKGQADADAQKQVQIDITACATLYTDGKKDDAKTKLDAIVKEHPNAVAQADSLRFNWLAQDDPAAWEVKATALASSKSPQKVMQLCQFAMSSLAKQPDLAKKAIGIALKGTENKDLPALFYAATIYQQTKDYQLALDNAQLALKVMPDSQYKGNDGLTKQLEAMVKAIQAKLQ